MSKLLIVMKSGAKFKIRVTDYTVRYDRAGNISTFNWQAKNKRSLVVLHPENIDAIVRLR